MDPPKDSFFSRSEFAFASPGVPHKERSIRYTYTGLELPSPFGAPSPLGNKQDGTQRYVASPMPAFSPAAGKCGMSPFAEFASGLPTLCTPGLVKDGAMPSPIMREVMLHQYTEVSPPIDKGRPVKKLFMPTAKQGGSAIRQTVQNEMCIPGMSFDPFADGDTKQLSGPVQPVEVPIHPNHQDPNSSFDAGRAAGRRGSAVTAGGAPREQKPCSCKKSRCLKKYCECYAAGKYCEGCYCTGCMNIPGAQKEQDSLNDQGPSSFQQMIDTPMVSSTAIPSPVERDGSPSMTAKGCHCKKSRCQKKYCECFQMNVLCTSKCECRECMNRSWDQRSPSARERGVQPRKRPRGGRPALAKDLNQPVTDPILMPMMSAMHQMDPMASAQLPPYARLQQPQVMNKMGMSSLDKANTPSPSLLDNSINSDLDVTFVGGFHETLTTDTPIQASREQSMLFQHLQEPNDCSRQPAMPPQGMSMTNQSV